MTEVVRTVEYADPSPIPETNKLWRRWYVFGVTVALCVHIGWMTLTQVKSESVLKETIIHDQMLIIAFAVLYLTGASSEAIVHAIVAMRTARRETITTESEKP